MLNKIIDKLKSCFGRIKGVYKRSGRDRSTQITFSDQAYHFGADRDLIFYYPEPIQCDPNAIEPYILAELLRLYQAVVHAPRHALRLLDRYHVRNVPRKLTITSGSEASDETSSDSYRAYKPYSRQTAAPYKKRFSLPIGHELRFHYLHFLDSDDSANDTEVFEEMFLTEEEE